MVTLVRPKMPKSKLEYRAVTTFEELRLHASQWDLLLNRAVQQSPMLSHSWISHHLTYFLEADQSWTCILAYTDERLVGVMTLVFSMRSWPVRHVIARSPFGSHLNMGDMLCDASLADDIVPGILGFTFASYPSLAYIELPRVSTESTTIGTWPAGSQLFTVSFGKRTFGDHLPPQDDFDAFEKTLSRNFRKNLSKAKNKLAKLDDVSFEYLQSDFDVTDCLTRFCNIERSGWKGRSGTAIAESSILVDFYSAVLGGLGKIGILEWHFLKCRDADLAGHMAFRIRNKLVLWKLAYNETYSACSPGSLLMRDLVAREIDAGTGTEIDLTTDQVWYRNWNLVNRSYYQIFIYNKSYHLGSIYRFIHGAYAALKKNPALRRTRITIKSFFRRS